MASSGILQVATLNCRQRSHLLQFAGQQHRLLPGRPNSAALLLPPLPHPLPLPLPRCRTMSGRAVAGEQPESDKEREARLLDAARRAAAAAGRYKADPELMQLVDELVESVPPSGSTYVLRLMLHALNPTEVAQENADAFTDEWFKTVGALLQSPQFKAATGKGTRAAHVLSVFDNAWRAAVEVRQEASKQG